MERRHTRILATINDRARRDLKAPAPSRRFGLVDVLASGQEALAAEVIEREGRAAVLFVGQVLGIPWDTCWAMDAGEFWHLYARAYTVQEERVKALEKQQREERAKRTGRG